MQSAPTKGPDALGVSLIDDISGGSNRVILPARTVCSIVFAWKPAGLAKARQSETAPHRILDGTGRERLAELTSQASSGVALSMALASCAELLIAAGAFGAKGITEDGIVLALRLTARFAFPLFWLAYTAGALVTLFGPRFEQLRRPGRALGHAFAAAMTVHLALVATLCVIGAAHGAGVFVIFATAAACMYVLALLSTPRLQ